MTDAKQRFPFRDVKIPSAAVLGDSRWKALASGKATFEELTDLRAWGEGSEEAALVYEALRPATDEELDQLTADVLHELASLRPNLAPDGPSTEAQPLLELVVFIVNHDEPLIHPLPFGSEVIIGRGDWVDIRIDDSSLSRQHAALLISSGIHIEDLGSAQGTAVRYREGRVPAAKNCSVTGVTGEPLDVSLGDCIVFGSVVATIRRAIASTERMSGVSSSSRLVVESPMMQELYERVQRVANSASSVLIVGEPGVGKEAVARTIHDASPRAKGPFVTIPCDTRDAFTSESKLFGSKLAVFPGTVGEERGLLELADGGTVFLEGIESLSPSAQARLLQVFVEGVVLRVGESQGRPIDIRVIAATNANLGELATRGEFRNDLLDRFQTCELEIPPLRSRVIEILPLARLFLEQESRRLDLTEVPQLSPKAIEQLHQYMWPSNVQELRNAIQRAIIVCNGSVVESWHLPPRISGESEKGPSSRLSGPIANVDALRAVEIDVPDERQRIVDALYTLTGNQLRAAEKLGMSRRTFVTRMELYGLSKPRKGSR